MDNDVDVDTVKVKLGTEESSELFVAHFHQGNVCNFKLDEKVRATLTIADCPHGLDQADWDKEVSNVNSHIHFSVYVDHVHLILLVGL